jgi:hypothetical protein
MTAPQRPAFMDDPSCQRAEQWAEEHGIHTDTAKIRAYILWLEARVEELESDLDQAMQPGECGIPWEDLD